MKDGYGEFTGQKMNLYTLGRLHDDAIAVRDRTRQSTDEGAWRLTNFHLQNPRAVERVAASEIQVTSQDGYGPGGRVVDTESDLKISSIQTHPNVPIHPQSRPIKTVPYMGGGRGNPYIESLLQKSEHIRDKKSCATVRFILPAAVHPDDPAPRKECSEPITLHRGDERPRVGTRWGNVQKHCSRQAL